jgi:DNA modification methylase
MGLLMHGDALEKLTEIEDHSVTLVLFDPPYGTTYLDWDIALDFSRLWTELWRVLKPDGAILCFSAQPFTTQVIASQYSRFRHCYYWIKEKGTGFLNVSTQPLRTVEEVCVFYRKLGYYDPQMIPREDPVWLPQAGTDSGMTKTKVVGDQPRTRRLTRVRHPTQVLEFPRESRADTYMPTQKPVPLLQWLIRTYTKEGNIVLDPTMGSGSTGVAALGLARGFIGIELDLKRFRMARKRIRQGYPDPV